MKITRKGLTLLLLVALTGCGHTNTAKVGLISFGNLEGKSLPSPATGPIVTGQSCGHSYKLSAAARDALKNSNYDTLIDAEVVNETGLLVWHNCLTVTGTALNSALLANAGGEK